ncbi:MAG TPA: alpha/beta hydrolase, partial [Usitatibacter sp.]|nr:alpha/beta hydrolase [Usitatibacter sp.]
APRTGGAPSVTPPSGLTFLFDTALRSDFLFWALLRGAPKLATRAILATPPEVVAAASLPEQARVAEMMRHILPVSPRRLGLLNDAAVTRAIPRYPLERIASPTLVLSAKDDGYGTWDCARYTAENIPNARFLGFESGGHLLVGHQDELRAEILAFLDPFCRILPPPFDNPLKARQSQPIEGGPGNE